MDTDIEILVTGNGSDVSLDFYEPIDIPMEEYDARIGIKNFSTFNNIPNIQDGVNNCLNVKVPGSNEYKEFKLPTGAYELSAIADQMQEWIELTYPDLKNVDKNFKLIGNDATSKAEFIFKDDYGIDFDIDGSMCDLLGFNRQTKFEGKGRHVGQKIVNITTTTQLVFNCNITESNYINGRECPFLYNCIIDVPVGFRLTRELTDIAYKRVNTSQISHIRIWIVDEDGAPINLRQDRLAVTLSLKLKPKVAKVSIVESKAAKRARRREE